MNEQKLMEEIERTIRWHFDCALEDAEPKKSSYLWLAIANTQAVMRRALGELAVAQTEETK